MQAADGRGDQSVRRPAALALILALVGAVGCDPQEPRPGPASPAGTETATGTPAHVTGLDVGIVQAPPDVGFAALLSQRVEAAAERWPDSGAEVRTARVLQPPHEDFRRDMLVFLADGGADVVCTVGPEGSESLLATAGEFPATRFCLLGDAAGRAPPANVAVVEWRLEEGGFLVGAAAALADPTAPVIVVVGATAPWADRIRVAIEAGARSVRPDVPVIVVSALGPDARRPAEDADVARSAVRDALAAAPIPATVVPVGGPATVDGAVAAAGVAGARVVGWALDPDELAPEGRDLVVASVLPDIGVGLETLLPLAGGESVTLGAADGGFALVAGGHPSGAGVVDRTRQLSGDVAAGRVSVPSPP